MKRCKAALNAEALANPRHPEHENLREWAPANFDAEGFDVAETTKIMRTAHLR